MKKFNLVVCGGTFEYLHSGHKFFLRFALSKSKKVIVGLTTDAFVKKAKKETQLSFDERKKTLEEFLKKEKAQHRVKIVAIDNIYIPKSLENLSFEAIVVTKDSAWGAREINKKRAEKGIPVLPIIVCPLLKTGGKLISSSKIRKTLNFSKTLILPDDLRWQLKKPMGMLIKDFNKWVKRQSLNPSKIITVGDVVTKACNDLLITQKISIIDFYVERQKRFSKIQQLGFSGREEVFTVENKAGTLSPLLFKQVKKMLSSKSSKRKIILVKGEEDLAVLPCMLFAPNGYTIFYGQPKQGVVKIDISQNSKEDATSIIGRFSYLY